MELKLVDGPWNKIFEGKIQNNPAEVYLNPDYCLLTMIYEESAGKKIGAVIELFQAYNVVGETEAFIETLPREAIGLIKHDESRTIKFFLLGSTPTYSALKEETLSAEVGNLMRKLKASASMVLDISKAYDLTLKELKECNDEVRDSFLSEPLAIPLVSGRMQKQTIQSTGETKPAMGEILLGNSKENIPNKEPAILFARTMITAGTKPERMHSIHLLVESMVISNVPIVLFDLNESFNGLREPSKSSEFKNLKSGAEPIGFPVKDFTATNEVKVDLGLIDVESLLEAFGVGNNQFNGFVKKIFESSKITSLDDAVQKISSEKIQKEEINEFQQKKAIRVLRLIDSVYPAFFNSPNDIPEISRSWLKGFGRIGLIHLKGIDERQNLLLTNNLAKGLLEYYRQNGPTKDLRTMIVLPEADKIINSNNPSKIVQGIVSTIIEGEQYGIGWILGSEKETDIKKEIFEKAIAQITIIKGNDAGIQLAGKKTYRTVLRISLSQCTEK